MRDHLEAPDNFPDTGGTRLAADHPNRSRGRDKDLKVNSVGLKGGFPQKLAGEPPYNQEYTGGRHPPSPDPRGWPRLWMCGFVPKWRGTARGWCSASYPSSANTGADAGHDRKGSEEKPLEDEGVVDVGCGHGRRPPARRPRRSRCGTWAAARSVGFGPVRSPPRLARTEQVSRISSGWPRSMPTSRACAFANRHVPAQRARQRRRVATTRMVWIGGVTRSAARRLVTGVDHRGDEVQEV